MAHAQELLRGQLEAYSESWKKPHEEAMEYWEVQSVVRLSLALYDSIFDLDTRWSEAIRSGGATFTIDSARAFERLYRDWNAPTQEIVRGIRTAENAGFEVDEKDRFHQACIRVKLILDTSVDEIMHAEKELREGRGIPLAEVRDELRRRHRASGG